MTNDERQEELFAVIEQNPDKPERYWPLVVEFVADWIAETPDSELVRNESLAKQWMEEMS